MDSPAFSEPSSFCARCGQPRSFEPHPACDAALALEPPRYCRACARRMVVQVTPAGWTAKCSEHGTHSHLVTA